MSLLRRRAVWALGLSALSACATQSNDNGPIGSDQAGASADGGASGSAGHAGSGAANPGSSGSSSSGASGTVGSAGAPATGSSGSGALGGSSAGTAGTSGAAGTAAGNGGTAGTSGVAGATGTAGSNGVSGSGGTAGGGAGHAGTGGAAGSAGSGGSGGSSAGAGGGSACTPTTLTLIATSDSNLSAAAPTSNLGIVAEAHIVRGGSANSQRALFEFDLSAIPAGKTLKTAQLQLTIVNNPGQNKTLAAHRVTQNPTRPWVETEVTWQAYKAGSNWTTAGGDFAATATDSQLVADAAAIGAVTSFNVLSDAQSFYATPATNFGWLIKDSQEPAAATGENVFYATRDTNTPDYKPKLVITYCP